MVQTVFFRNSGREAFSHKPTWLEYNDDGVIICNGIERGYLVIIDEVVAVGEDVMPHPRTAMDPDAGLLTRRPLRVKLICKLQCGFAAGNRTDTFFGRVKLGVDKVGPLCYNTQALKSAP